MRGPRGLPSNARSPDYGCTCGEGFSNYTALAEHVRMTIDCPRCGAVPVALGDGDLYRWDCGHWMARDDRSAMLRDSAQEKTP